MRGIFREKSEIQTVLPELLLDFGTQIPLGEAVFIFWPKIGLKSSKNVRFCILFRPMGGFEPPHPPWLRYCLICQNSRTKTMVKPKLSPNSSSRLVPIKNFQLKTKRNFSEQNRSAKAYRDRPIQIALYGCTSQIQMHNLGQTAYKSNIPNTKISRILELSKY